MRGRTLEDCFIILDEAQIKQELKWNALTRLGRNSQMVEGGYYTDWSCEEKDLSKRCFEKIDKIEDIGFVNLMKKMVDMS